MLTLQILTLIGVDMKKDAMMDCKIIRKDSNIFVPNIFPNKIFKLTLYFSIRGMLSHRRFKAGVFVKSR